MNPEDFITKVDHVSDDEHRMGISIPFLGTDPEPSVPGFAHAGNDTRPAAANHTHSTRLHIATGDPEDVEATMTHPGDGTMYLDDTTKGLKARFADGWHTIGGSSSSLPAQIVHTVSFTADNPSPRDITTYHQDSITGSGTGYWDFTFELIASGAASDGVAVAVMLGSPFRGQIGDTAPVGSGFASPLNGTTCQLGGPIYLYVWATVAVSIAGYYVASPRRP